MQERLTQLLQINQANLESIVIASIILACAIVIGIVLSAVVLFIVRKLDEHIEPDKVNILVDAKRWRGPMNCLVPALCIALALPLLNVPEKLDTFFRHLLGICVIGSVAFLLIRIVGIVKDLILSKLDLTVKDNLKARAAHTQLLVIQRIFVFGIVIVGASCMLMTFDKVKQIGVSLLASAGVVGVILGFAAQRSIATVFAGIQIALTQPIRVDDVVIVEGEWGRIEEITLTYVVVKIWDLRRLVLPITYFIEKPFQNWTRTSADILGTVFIYADYSIPFEPLRQEIKRLVEASPLWDKKVCGMQITDAKEKTVEIRALMSTSDASKGWDLRCIVREKLIEYMQKNYPASLPRVRVTLEKEPVNT